MKIIFLDIDGVLNCYGDFKKPDEIYVLNKLMIRRFHRIVKQTGAEVVLSSTWRLYDKHMAYLRENNVNFIDVTIDLKVPYSIRYGRRGAEIEVWLKEHKDVERYVILDDVWDFLDEQRPFFIQTDWCNGLLLKHVKQAINILND